MEKKDDLLEGQTDSEEENLFDLSLDDLSPEDIDQEPEEKETDEEIIELLDLVEKGEKDLESGDGEIAQILEEEKPTEELEGAAIPEDASDDVEPLSQIETDLDLGGITMDSGLGIDGGPEPAEEIFEEDIATGDIEKMLEEEGDQGMYTTFDGDIEPEESLEDLIGTADLEEHVMDEETELEEEIKEEDIAESDLEDMLEEEPVDEMSMTIESPIGSDEAPGAFEATDLKEPEAQMEAEPPEEEIEEEADAAKEVVPVEEKEPSAHLAGEEMIGISEERIEAIVTRVVGDVVERVARETMTNVAEKVIREAIDTLKQSLETDSD
ncbi:hypothetical protein ACFL0H_06270 [Thermodesulfobacteriota bacterium]